MKLSENDGNLIPLSSRIQSQIGSPFCLCNLFCFLGICLRQKERTWHQKFSLINLKPWKKGEWWSSGFCLGRYPFFWGGERVVLDVGSWEGNNTKSIQIFHSNKGEIINHDIAHIIIKVIKKFQLIMTQLFDIFCTYVLYLLYTWLSCSPFYAGSYHVKSSRTSLFAKRRTCSESVSNCAWISWGAKSWLQRLGKLVSFSWGKKLTNLLSVAHRGQKEGVCFCFTVSSFFFPYGNCLGNTGVCFTCIPENMTAGTSNPKMEVQNYFHLHFRVDLEVIVWRFFFCETRYLPTPGSSPGSGMPLAEPWVITNWSTSVSIFDATRVNVGKQQPQYIDQESPSRRYYIRKVADYLPIIAQHHCIS